MFSCLDRRKNAWYVIIDFINKTLSKENIDPEEQNVKLTNLASCGGCGAKVGAGVLAQLLDGLQVLHDPNLPIGFDKSDDASVYKVSDDLALVQTADFFPPMVDDPYLFGQIAATNDLSDVYAMGGEPKLAPNLLCVPEKMPKEAVHQLLKGGYDKVYEAGTIITGGHSILDQEPKYGLAVTGFVHPDKELTNSGAKPGMYRCSPSPLESVWTQAIQSWPSRICSAIPGPQEVS